MSKLETGERRPENKEWRPEDGEKGERRPETGRKETGGTEKRRVEAGNREKEQRRKERICEYNMVV